MSQNEFARELAIAQSIVSRYEKGEAIPSGDIFLKIGKLGKIVMKEIMEGGNPY